MSILSWRRGRKLGFDMHSNAKWLVASADRLRKAKAIHADVRSSGQSLDAIHAAHAEALDASADLANARLVDARERGASPGTIRGHRVAYQKTLDQIMHAAKERSGSVNSLSHYYASARGYGSSVSSEDAMALGEDMVIAGVAGAAVALISTAKGSADLNVGGMPIPLDGLMAVALGAASLGTHSPMLHTASVAAAGAASARVFSRIFTRNIGAHGDIEDGTYSMGMGGNVPYGGNPLNPYPVHYQTGWGADSEHDRLVEAAKNL